MTTIGAIFKINKIAQVINFLTFLLLMNKNSEIAAKSEIKAAIAPQPTLLPIVHAPMATFPVCNLPCTKMVS